jgi:ketosteroid isomerase-like protein
MMMGRLCAVLFLLLAAPQVGFAQSADAVAKAKAEIWAKEKAIYAGRANGSVQYYFDNTSPDYLAWVYGTPKPFRRDVMSGKGQKMKDKEKIDTQFSDFSLHGDTAIIYYVNHRTMTPDGTPVDQVFDNIHVWVRDGSDWKVLASMSRLEKPAH